MRCRMSFFLKAQKVSKHKTTETVANGRQCYLRWSVEFNCRLVQPETRKDVAVT